MDVREFRIGHLVLQPDRQLLDQGRPLRVGSKALALLSTLAAANGELVTKDELMVSLWPNSIVEENVIQVHVAALRKLMGEAAPCLATVWGVGYRLEASPSPMALTVASDDTEAPSLAVLPFSNRSGLPEDSSFAANMADDIVATLSQGVHVRVLASLSTAGYGEAEQQDSVTLGRKLGVRYLLSGNVRRIGDELLVTSQLVESASSIVLWTRKFGGDKANLARLQVNLVADLSAHLDAQVYRIEMARALKKSDNLTAWDAVTRAFANLHHASAPSISVQIEEAQRGVEISPLYGPARAMLAQSLAIRYCNFFTDDQAEIARIRQHVDKALSLDRYNALTLAHAAQALNMIGLADQGLRLGKEAVDVSPGMAFALHACGSACTLLNLTDEAVAHFQAEVKASPGAHTHYLSFSWQANALMRAGRWVEAETLVDQSLSLNPDYSISIAIKALLCQLDGRERHAREVFAHGRTLEPDVRDSLWELRVRRRFSGNPITGKAVDAMLSLCAAG